MNNFIQETLSKRYKVCSECGQKQVEWKESLTKGMVRALIKFHDAIREYNRNNINIHRLDGTPYAFTHSEKCNWTKVRYHGLVFIVEGEIGRFGLTKRGYDFLHNGLAVPDYVWSYNHRLSTTEDAHSTRLVTLRDIIKTDTFFQTIDLFEAREVEPKQEALAL